MRNTYKSPEIEILYISEDIITESNGSSEPLNGSYTNPDAYEGFPDMPIS